MWHEVYCSNYDNYNLLKHLDQIPQWLTGMLNCLILTSHGTERVWLEVYSFFSSELLHRVKTHSPQNATLSSMDTMKIVMVTQSNTMLSSMKPSPHHHQCPGVQLPDAYQLMIMYHHHPEVNCSANPCSITTPLLK